MRWVCGRAAEAAAACTTLPLLLLLALALALLRSHTGHANTAAHISHTSAEGSNSCVRGRSTKATSAKQPARSSSSVNGFAPRLKSSTARMHAYCARVRESTRGAEGGSRTATSAPWWDATCGSRCVAYSTVSARMRERTASVGCPPASDPLAPRPHTSRSSFSEMDITLPRDRAGTPCWRRSSDDDDGAPCVATVPVLVARRGSTALSTTGICSSMRVLRLREASEIST